MILLAANKCFIASSTTFVQQIQERKTEEILSNAFGLSINFQNINLHFILSLSSWHTKCQAIPHLLSIRQEQIRSHFIQERRRSIVSTQYF